DSSSAGATAREPWLPRSCRSTGKNACIVGSGSNENPEMRCNLTPEESLCLLQTCRWLRLPESRRFDSASLQVFLVCRLSGQAPQLAGKVLELSEPEMADLYTELRDRQQVAASLLAS